MEEGTFTWRSLIAINVKLNLYMIQRIAGAILDHYLFFLIKIYHFKKGSFMLIIFLDAFFRTKKTLNFIHSMYLIHH